MAARQAGVEVVAVWCCQSSCRDAVRPHLHPTLSTLAAPPIPGRHRASVTPQTKLCNSRLLFHRREFGFFGGILPIPPGQTIAHQFGIKALVADKGPTQCAAVTVGFAAVDGDVFPEGKGACKLFRALAKRLLLFGAIDAIQAHGDGLLPDKYFDGVAVADAHTSAHERRHRRRRGLPGARDGSARGARWGDRRGVVGWSRCALGRSISTLAGALEAAGVKIGPAHATGAPTLAAVTATATIGARGAVGTFGAPRGHRWRGAQQRQQQRPKYFVFHGLIVTHHAHKAGLMPIAATTSDVQTVRGNWCRLAFRRLKMALFAHRQSTLNRRVWL